MTTTTENAELARVSFKTTPAQLATVEQLARLHQRTLSGEIRMALDVWIERCSDEEATQS